MSRPPLTPRQRELNAEAERRVKRRDRGAAAYRIRESVHAADAKIGAHVRAYEDTPLDAARVLGLRPDKVACSTLGCSWCADLPWRRPERGHCPGCFQRHETEKIEAPEPQGFSALHAFATW